MLTVTVAGDDLKEGLFFAYHWSSSSFVLCSSGDDILLIFDESMRMIFIKSSFPFAYVIENADMWKKR